MMKKVNMVLGSVFGAGETAPAEERNIAMTRAEETAALRKMGIKVRRG